MDKKDTPSSKRASITFTRNHPGSLSPRRFPTSSSYASALSSTAASAFYPSAAVRRELELERCESSASTTGRASSASRRQHDIGSSATPVSRRSMDFDPTLTSIRHQRRSLMSQMTSNISTTGVREGRRMWNVWKIRKLVEQLLGIGKEFFAITIAALQTTQKIDNRPAIVIEIGNRFTRVGLAGEFTPTEIFRSDSLFIKENANKEQNENLILFFRSIVFRKLITSISSRRVVIVESLLTPTWQRQALAHALFDCASLAPHSILFAPSHLLCSFPFNARTCIVLDLGANEAVLFPIVEGILMLNNWETSAIACASALESEAKRLMLKYGQVRRRPLLIKESSVDDDGADNLIYSNDGRPFAECDLALADSMRLWEDLVFRFCFVTTAARGRRLQAHLTNSDSPLINRPVPPVQIQFGSELLYIPGIVREAVAELLFTHNDEIGCRSVPQLLLDCISRVPIDLRRELLQNLLIVGGISRLPGFFARLKTELLDLIADGYKTSLSSDLTDIKFYQFPREVAGELFCAWLGGSMFGSLDYIVDQRSITRQEWLKTKKVKDWTDELDKYFSELNIIKNDKMKEILQHINYFPQFISETEEANLLKNVYAAPKPKWRQLSNRRLQNWGGVINDKNILMQENLPLVWLFLIKNVFFQWLESCIDKILQIPSVSTFPDENRPNHVLINEYLPGQGILPHTDGPAFFPMISTISLGSHSLLNFYEENDGQRQKVGSLFLEPRSLILISGNAYKLLHGIDEVTIDTVNLKDMLNYSKLDQSPIFDADSIDDLITFQRKTRVSLTIRNVPLKRKLFCMK